MKKGSLLPLYSIPTTSRHVPRHRALQPYPRPVRLLGDARAIEPLLKGDGALEGKLEQLRQLVRLDHLLELLARHCDDFQRVARRLRAPREPHWTRVERTQSCSSKLSRTRRFMGWAWLNAVWSPSCSRRKADM